MTNDEMYKLLNERLTKIEAKQDVYLQDITELKTKSGMISTLVSAIVGGLVAFIVSLFKN
ncbi:MAG: hypothetical protein ACKVPJ_13445 [Chitinophagales bacterium]